MHASPVELAILNGWSFIALFAWVWFLLMAALIPAWMLGVLVYLARIARQLRRHNDGERTSVPATAAPPDRVSVAPSPRSLGHQLLR
jgi:hypothetical protein